MMTPVAEATLARAEALRLEAFYIGAWDNLKANQPEKQRGPCSLLFEGPCLQGKKRVFFFNGGVKRRETDKFFKYGGFEWVLGVFRKPLQDDPI